jgi:hypothetical protein
LHRREGEDQRGVDERVDVWAVEVLGRSKRDVAHNLAIPAQDRGRIRELDRSLEEAEVHASTVRRQ